MNVRRLGQLLALAIWATSVSAAPPAEQLSADVNLLAHLQIISSPDYWLETATQGQHCDGQRVASLLVKMASSMEPVTTLDEALRVLAKRNIVINDYWKQNAVAGRQCEGPYVANLIRAAADYLAEEAVLKRYGSPAGFLATAEPSAFALEHAAPTSTSFNYVLGTQTFGAAYQFTTKPLLLETAEAIRALGGSVIKFELTPRYAGAHRNTQSADPGIRSLADLAAREPAHRQTLDMPFAHFVLWAHTFAGGENRWQSGFSEQAAHDEYREIYDLTRHLLQTYHRSGKIFYLGHWEGDGFLRGSVARENDAKVTPARAQGMADWLNTRQRAVDDARRDTPHERVAVWHYTEVNHVKLAMQGRPALASEVLPKTSVDLVSYSAYDTQDDPALLKAALNYIEAQLPPKPSITGRRVFIGEYGFPAVRFSPAEQDARSRRVMLAGLEWGCPLVLYWELFNNEVDADGKQRGFWLIDDHGVKQPVYTTHRRFYEWGQAFVDTAIARTGQAPTSAEFRQAAASFLIALPPAPVDGSP